VSASFAGRSVLVTGGGSGIGAAAALQFAAAGATVFIADLDEAGAASTVDRIRAGGGRAESQHADVSDERQVDELVAQAIASFGRLDCAFNNAGISAPRTSITDCSLADWRRTVDINLTSVFLCMRAELRHMKALGHGAVVNTSSTAGVRPSGGVAAYAASKHGVIGLTKSVAGEFAGTEIRVKRNLPWWYGHPSAPRVDRS